MRLHRHNSTPLFSIRPLSLAFCVCVTHRPTPHTSHPTRHRHSIYTFTKKINGICVLLWLWQEYIQGIVFSSPTYSTPPLKEQRRATRRQGQDSGPRGAQSTAP
ncbi:hypothetical protein E2C01_087040 [Portunus trituberculatus]|uniref:Uncharacterized protein n=1 Tax=Portunus trituberculatus TaxID=210409 RepID=A0A5B7JC98_PORTR|nr:hypothetical protein [Portunus trituberculatus]